MTAVHREYTAAQAAMRPLVFATVSRSHREVLRAMSADLTPRTRNARREKRKERRARNPLRRTIYYFRISLQSSTNGGILILRRS